MVRKTTRRGVRVLVIDISFTKSDGSMGRYRRDAELQTMEGARAEERRRMMAVAKTGSPFEATDEAARALVAPALPAELTFAEVVKRYEVEYAPTRLKETTRVAYEGRLRTWILPRIGALPISAVDAKVIRDLDGAFVQGGASDGLRRAILIALRSVLTRFAVETEIITRAPKFPPLPKDGNRIVEVPLPEDFACVVDAAKHPEHRVAFLLAGHAGLRRGEVRALRCRDVEFEGQGRIVVRFQKYKHDLTKPKSGSDREIPLTGALRQALLAVGADRRPKDSPVALTTRGKPWGEKGLWLALNTALKRAQLDPCRYHALRHFFVTSLFHGGVSAPVVQKLAGHSNLATTQRYAHIQGADRSEAIAALDASYKGPIAPLALPRGRKVGHSATTRRVTKGRGGVLRSRMLARASARKRGNS